MASATSLLVNRFVKLDQKRKRREGEIDELKEQLKQIGDELLARFEKEGTKSVKTKSGHTVYVRRELWAGTVVGAEAALFEGLRALGHGDMIKEKVNTQTLSAYIRELETAQFGNEPQRPDDLLKALPDAIRHAVQLSEKFSVQARKS